MTSLYCCNVFHPQLLTCYLTLIWSPFHMSAPAFLSGRLCALRAGHCFQYFCPCPPVLRTGVVPKCSETSWSASFHVKMVISLQVSPSGVSLKNKCQSWSTVLGSRICFVRGSFAFCFQRLSRLIKFLQRLWNSETFNHKEWGFFDLVFHTNCVCTFKTGHSCIHLRENVAQQTCDKH